MWGLLSVDTGSFVLWLVYAVIRHTKFVPFILSVWQLDVGDTASGEREALGRNAVKDGR